MNKLTSTLKANNGNKTNRNYAGAFKSLVFTGAMAFGFMNTNTNAQCVTMETGDITGNVNYGSSINWANPNRVEISDDVYARTSLSPGDTTKYLMVADFGYVMPLSAVISGITVELEVSMEQPNTDARDASVKLMKAGVPVGADRVNPMAIWQNKDNVNTYGGPTDLWGTTWTAADINSVDFGVLYSVTRGSGPNNHYVKVDYVTLRVHYADVSCILPVNISYFAASVQENGKVALNWTTEAELNSSMFEVMRSTDGQIYSTVGMINGAGTSSVATEYQFEDESPAEGINYYRLRHMDYDGRTTYSEVVTATAEPSEEFTVKTYPNPTTGTVTITTSSTEGFEAILTNLEGRIMQNIHVETPETTLEIGEYPPGIYLLQVESGVQKQIHRIVKK